VTEYCNNNQFMTITYCYTIQEFDVDWMADNVSA